MMLLYTVLLVDVEYSLEGVEAEDIITDIIREITVPKDFRPG